MWVNLEMANPVNDLFNRLEARGAIIPDECSCDDGVAEVDILNDGKCVLENERFWDELAPELQEERTTLRELLTAAQGL